MLKFTASKTVDYKAPYYLGRYCEVFGLPPAKFKFNTLLTFAEQGALLNSMGITFQDPDVSEADTWQLFSADRSNFLVSESRMLRHPLITDMFRSGGCDPSTRFHASLLLPFVEIYAAHRLGCSMPGHVITFDDLEYYFKQRKKIAKLVNSEGHASAINNGNTDAVSTALMGSQKPASGVPLASPASPTNPQALHSRGGHVGDESDRSGDPEQVAVMVGAGESQLARNDVAQTQNDGVAGGALPETPTLPEQEVKAEKGRARLAGADTRDSLAAAAKGSSQPSPTRQDSPVSSLEGGEGEDEKDSSDNEPVGDVMSFLASSKK